MNNFKSQYRPEIDGLRALAIICVIINHFNKKLLPSGYLGVDIFFIISGFVITSSIVGRKNNNFKEFIFDFYRRRIKRLFPALIIFVIIMSITICIVNPDPQLNLRTGISSLFGISNVYQIKQATNYFDESTQLNVFTHTWSLGVEEQFYFFFPFLIWFTGFGRKTNFGFKNYLFTILFLSIISLILYVFFSFTNGSISYFSMPTRFWEISTGSLLFLLVTKENDSIENSNGLIPLCLFLAIIGIMFLPIKYSVAATILVVILSSALIYFLRKGTFIFNLLTNKKIVFIGLISYSLYLWHWGILALSRWTIGINLWTIPIQLILIFAIALISYRYIETPLREKNWSKKDSTLLLKGAFILISSAFFLIGLEYKLSKKLYSGDKELLDIVAKGNRLDNPTGIYRKTLFGGRDCYLMSNNDVNKLIDEEICVLGNFKKANQRILVIGNSYSSAFINAFEEIVKNDNSVFLTSSWGSSPVPSIPNKTSWDEANDYYWNKLVPRLLEKLKKGDVVFIMNAIGDKNLNNKYYLNLLEKGLEKFSKRLSERSIKLLFLNAIPSNFKDKDNNKCSVVNATDNWFNTFNRCNPVYKSKNIFINERLTLTKMLEDLEKKNLLTSVDLIDIFCPSELCTFWDKDGIPLYRDQSHPSVFGARQSSFIIKKSLDKLNKGNN